MVASRRFSRRKGVGKHLLAGVLLLTTHQVFMKLNCDNINLSLCSCISDTDDVRFLSAKGQ